MTRGVLEQLADESKHAEDTSVCLSMHGRYSFFYRLTLLQNNQRKSGHAMAHARHQRLLKLVPMWKRFHFTLKEILNLLLDDLSVCFDPLSVINFKLDYCNSLSSIQW